MDEISYSVSLCLQNAMAIGFVPTESGTDLRNKLERADDVNVYLNLTTSLDDKNNFVGWQKQWNKRIVHVCGDAECCKYSSRISVDCMHWCMKETGGRLNAALACLLQCSLKDGESTNDDEWVRCSKKRASNSKTKHYFYLFRYTQRGKTNF